MKMVSLKTWPRVAAAVALALLTTGAVSGAAGARPPTETTLLATAVRPSTFASGPPAGILPVLASAAGPILISPGAPSVPAAATPIPSASGIPAASGPLPGLDLSRLQKPLLDRFAFHRTEEVLFDANLVILAAANVADYLSTREALKHPGLYEANPLMKPFTGNEFAFAAVKAGTTVLNHLALKKLFKRNRTAAWLLAAASNFVISYAVVNNMRLIRQARSR